MPMFNLDIIFSTVKIKTESDSTYWGYMYILKNQLRKAQLS